jgi:hypothetical protein
VAEKIAIFLASIINRRYIFGFPTTHLIIFVSSSLGKGYALP